MAKLNILEAINPVVSVSWSFSNHHNAELLLKKYFYIIIVFVPFANTLKNSGLII